MPPAPARHMSHTQSCCPASTLCHCNTRTRTRHYPHLGIRNTICHPTRRGSGALRLPDSPGACRTGSILCHCSAPTIATDHRLRGARSRSDPCRPRPCKLPARAHRWYQICYRCHLAIEGRRSRIWRSRTTTDGSVGSPRGKHKGCLLARSAPARRSCRSRLWCLSSLAIPTSCRLCS